MQYQQIRSQLNALSLTLGLPALALVSFLGATPSLAAVQAPSEVTTTGEDPVQVANIFDLIETVTEGVQVIQTINDAFQGAPASRQQPRPEASGTTRQRPSIGTQFVDPEVVRQQQSPTPEQQAEQQAAQQAEGELLFEILGTILMNGGGPESMAAPLEPTRVTRPNGMSESEYACYIDPNCGR
ncbi:hypothetical protein IQ273_14030 [Nodosilinea sp. LEGE 07298]|uniref:hypothetical protein n=1 Tax=Nodosilinea sp. LEGE 07298 TaxID=2777970 RepID=UPI001882D88A|nr:hypothetical protein [Nodosilinea sp. LEGE 07298]MBE9110535.1 hypothetical protein [Nodosilinea sp. LEGE 07298]